MRRFSLLAILPLLALAPLAGCDNDAPEDTTPPPFFVGNWATSAERCNVPWVITATDLNTGGGVTCHFEALIQTDLTYDIAATCQAAQGQADNYMLRASRTLPGPGLVIEGAPFPALPLVRCP
jgi:hypothetical protein